jgi:hypothetical protein
MTNERMERRIYRKSPGRQYSDDYESHGSRGTGRSTAGQRQAGETRWPSVNGSRTATSGSLLTQRPDPRLTRQLLRKHILASKAREGAALYDEEQMSALLPEEELPSVTHSHTLYSHRHSVRSRRARPYEEELPSEEWEQEPLAAYEGGVGNESDYPEELEPQAAYESAEEEDWLRQRPLPRRVSRRLVQPEELPPEYEEELYEEEPQRRRKRILTRRRVLLGLGVAATGGAAIAATQLAPKIPQAIGNTASNIEHQINDAFNRGFQAGADAVRKDFINALEDMEGVSLDAAMGAARLLRSAYDVFVNPLLTLAANVAGDFLSVTLRAYVQARHWLANIGQDNSTLASLQTVLETWTKQVTQMPKQLQAITDADLDGAQAYLRGVQRKIQAEKAKLNSSTPQATASPSPAPSSKKKS